MGKHRNFQKRFHEVGFVYFVTGKTKDDFPFFRIDPKINLGQVFCELWMEELSSCKNLKQFELYAFCLPAESSRVLGIERRRERTIFTWF